MSDNIENTTSLVNAVICIGKTGNGKSTLTKLHVPDMDSNLIGHGAISRTKGFKIHKENDNRIWVDTMGTDDYEGKMNDEDILRQTLYGLNTHYPNGLYINCIWFVPPNSLRSDHSLQTQAKFIHSLSGFDSRDNDKNAWKSTFIVIKAAQLKPLEDHTLGPQVAAGMWNAPVKETRRGQNQIIKIGDVNVLGYTLLDALPENHMSLRLASSVDTNLRLESGWLYKNEVIQYTNDELKKLDSIKIEFKNFKCNKCNTTGDKRFAPLRCHTDSTMIHPQANNKIHTQNWEYRHPTPNSFNRYHSGSTESYHTRSTGSITSGSETYTSGTKTLCGNGHTTVYDWGTVTSGTFTCKRGCKYGVGSSLYYCTKCKPNNFNYKYNNSGSWKTAIWCPNHISKQDVTSSRSTYKTVYLCCERSTSSSGCMQRMSCCGNSVGSLGCKQTYACCGKSVGSQGCQQYYKCCNTLVSANRPCSFACCRRNIYTGQPCKKICRSCTKDWGTKGCRSDSKLHEWEEI